jgi:hypothetical protein
MARHPSPASPSISDLGQALATPNDWRAIVIVMSFVIVTLVGFIIWREFSLVGLRRAIDKMSEAIWLLRLTLVEKEVAERHERGNDV